MTHHKSLKRKVNLTWLTFQYPNVKKSYKIDLIIKKRVEEKKNRKFESPTNILTKTDK